MSHSQNRSAAVLAILASAILSFIDNFVYMVSQEAGLWQFQVVRMLFALPVFLIWARMMRVRINPANLRRTVLRSALVAFGLLIYFASLGVLPVAQAAAGLFSSPLWILIFAFFLFRAPITAGQFLAMALGFAGVLMLLQPDLSGLSAVSLLPLLAGAFYGLGMLVTRHWCHEEGAITLAMGVFTMIGLLSAGLLTFFTLWPVASATPQFLTQGWVAITPMFLILTFGQAIGAVLAVSLITQAYRTGDPSYVAVFEYSFLIFAALWTYLLWGSGINALAVMGIGTILTSGAILSARRHSRRPA